MAQDEANTNINSLNSNPDTSVPEGAAVDNAVNNNPYKMHASNKILIALLVIFIAALIALYFYNDANSDETMDNTEAEQVEQPTPTPTATPTPTPTPIDELQTDEVIMELESTNENSDIDAQLESLNFDEIGTEINSDTY